MSSHCKTRAHFPNTGKVNYPLYHDAVEVSPIPTDIKIGSIVTFTNYYGVRIPGIKVTGFTPIIDGSRFIYLDYDCFWFPAKPEDLDVTEASE